MCRCVLIVLKLNIVEIFVHLFPKLDIRGWVTGQTLEILLILAFTLLPW